MLSIENIEENNISVKKIFFSKGRLFSQTRGHVNRDSFFYFKNISGGPPKIPFDCGRYEQRYESRLGEV